MIVVDSTDDGAMTEVVRAAAGLARPGDTVLLAPAAASYDMFAGYGARGDAFAAAARGLPTTARDDVGRGACAAGVRGARSGRERAAAVQRFARPAATRRSSCCCSPPAGLLGFGVLMAVSTTIAAAHADNGSRLDLGPGRSRRSSSSPLGLVAVLVRGAPVAARVPAAGLPDARARDRRAGRRAGAGHRRRRSTARAAGSTSGPLQLQPSELAKVAMLLWGADLLARKQQLGTLRRARHLFVPLVPGFALVAPAGHARARPRHHLLLHADPARPAVDGRHAAALLRARARHGRGAAITVLAVAAPYRLQRLTTFTDPFKHAKGTRLPHRRGLVRARVRRLLRRRARPGHVEVRLGAQRQLRLRVRDHRRGARADRLPRRARAVRRCSPTPACGSCGAAPTRSCASPPAAATIWLCGQAVINIGYVSGLLPVTGIPLPLISAGGTSLLVTFFVLGMLVSFARHETGGGQRRPARPSGCGRRTRLERWARIPVPRAYAPPKRTHRAPAPRRRAAAAAPRARRPTPRRAARRRAAARRARPRATARRGARPAPTDGAATDAARSGAR